MKTKILLIDDDVLIHFINKKLLENEYPGEDTFFFNSALQALDFLQNNSDSQEHSFVIFLDINMPEMNGWQFMEALEKEFKEHSFEIHLLTSSVDKEDQDKALEYDYVKSYIFKPLNKVKLLQVLDSIPEQSSK